MVLDPSRFILKEATVIIKEFSFICGCLTCFQMARSTGVNQQ